MVFKNISTNLKREHPDAETMKIIKILPQVKHLSRNAVALFRNSEHQLD